MEKRTPHCELSRVKLLIHEGKVRTTHTARFGAVALGFDYLGMLAVVLALEPADFYKSMTTHADCAIWKTCTVRRRRPAMCI
jgi:motility quorum-sensing regulator/GCU-specific mRNA interferase toxin